MSKRPQMTDIKPLQSSTAMYSLSSQARKEVKKTGSRKARLSCTGHGWEHRQCWWRPLPGHLPYLTDAHPEGHARRKEANPMLKTIIQWDGHETSTASADNTALLTALTFRTTGSSQHDEWHKIWPPVKFFKAFIKKKDKRKQKPSTPMYRE